MCTSVDSIRAVRETLCRATAVGNYICIAASPSCHKAFGSTAARAIKPSELRCGQFTCTCYQFYAIFSVSILFRVFIGSELKKKNSLTSGCYDVAEYWRLKAFTLSSCYYVVLVRSPFSPISSKRHASWKSPFRLCVLQTMNNKQCHLRSIGDLHFWCRRRGPAAAMLLWRQCFS